jgi:hypothetical protein
MNKIDFLKYKKSAKCRISCTLPTLQDACGKAKFKAGGSEEVHATSRIPRRLKPGRASGHGGRFAV